MGAQHLLDLGGVDVEPGDEDEVGAPVDEAQVVVLVEDGDVAGVQPAVDEGPAGGGGVIPVAGEHVRALHPDLAGVAGQDVGAVLVDEADGEAGQRPADGAGPGWGGAERGGADDRGGLREPVALVDDDVEAVPERGRDRVGERGGAGHGEAHRREGVRRRVGRVELEPVAEHRGDAGEDAHPGLGDEAGGGRGLEPLDEERRRAGGEAAAEDDVQPEDVGAGQHGQADVVGSHREAGVPLDLADVGGQVGVGEHRGTGRAGGARGEEEHGDVVGGALDTRRGVVGERVEVDAADPPAYGGGERRCGPGGEGQGSVDRAELPVELGGRRRRVQRHAHRAGVQDGEVRDDERHPVRADDRHPVAGPHTVGGEVAGEASRGVGERPVGGGLAALVAQRGGVGGVRRGAEQHSGEVHGGIVGVDR